MRPRGSTGPRPWQELVWVTLPMMLPTILVTFAFRLVLAFKVFDEVYLLTGGGPGTATEVVSFTLYQRFFTEDRAGYGAAMSVSRCSWCRFCSSWRFRRARDRRPGA